MTAETANKVKAAHFDDLAEQHENTLYLARQLAAALQVATRSMTADTRDAIDENLTSTGQVLDRYAQVLAMFRADVEAADLVEYAGLSVVR